ncbi:GNAT family N-acetyltransferase [Rheinheimera sp.]|uniref:GNAT family N-acetyltransferase n=1 Tax=Rheinheimera sp. TaxID=1869214 RepID=UPI0040474C8F
MTRVTASSAPAGLSYGSAPWGASFVQWIASQDNALQADLAAYWLDATARIMLPERSVYCHYLQNQQGEIVLLLPLVHHNGVLAPRFSLLTSFYASLGCFYGNTEPTLVQGLLQHIFGHWRCCSIELAPLAEDASDTCAVLGATTVFNAVCFERFVNYYQPINSDFAGYIAGRPALLRHTLKRKQKKIAALGGETRLYQTVAELQQQLVHFHQVYQHSWKQPEYSSRFIDEVCLAAASCGDVRLGLLTLQQQVIAAQIWFVRGGVASIFKLAYNAEFAHLSPGTVLTAAMFQQVIDIDAVSCVDYGMGAEAYKADWMACKRRRIGILLFNLRSVSGWLSWCRHALPRLLLGRTIR